MSDEGTRSVSIAERAAFGAGWVIAWRMVSRNLGLVSTLILVRLLQPADFGLVALAAGFINAIDSLSTIGVHDALVRSPTINRALYNTGFTLNVIRGLLTAAAIVAIALPVGHFFDDPRLSVVMLALAFGTLLSAFENIGVVDFRRDLVFRKEFNLQVTVRLLGVLMTITSAAILHSYWALVVGILTYRVVNLVGTYVMSGYRPAFTLCAWRGIIAFSLWSWAQTLVNQVRERSNSVVIGRVVNTTQVGVFSVGLEIAQLPITEISEPMARALFPGFAAVQNAARDVASMFIGAVGVGFMLIFPAGLGISMVADPLVRIALGENWTSTIPAVQLLAIGGVTAIFCQSCGVLMNAIGRPHVSFYVACAATLVQLVALTVLVPYAGVTGAALAVLSAQATDLVLFLTVAFLLVGIAPSRLLAACIRTIIAAGSMVLTLHYVGWAWTPSAATEHLGLWLDLGRRSAVGGACYVAVLAGLWLAVGRPTGPEQQVLRLASRLWLRVLGVRRLSPAP